MEQHSTGERKAVRMCVGLCVVMSECIEMCDVNTAEEENKGNEIMCCSFPSCSPFMAKVHLSL